MSYPNVGWAKRSVPTSSGKQKHSVAPTKNLSQQQGYPTQHGCFLIIQNQGVLIQGESGIGKSELALTLIDRGHILVADDIIQWHVCEQKLIGRAPTPARGLMALRDVGIIDIRHRYGARAFQEEYFLSRVICLKHSLPERSLLLDNLQQIEIMGLSFPRVDLLVTPGRALAPLVEITLDLPMAVVYPSSSEE